MAKVYGGLPYPTMKEGINYISTPDGYTLAPASVFGRATLVPVPTIALPDNVLRLAASGGASKGSCSCTQGTCTLKTHNVVISQAIFCEGDCTGTCTIVLSRIVGGGEEIEYFKAISYKF